MGGSCHTRSVDASPSRWNDRLGIEFDGPQIASRIAVAAFSASWLCYFRAHCVVSAQPFVSCATTEYYILLAVSILTTILIVGWPVAQVFIFRKVGAQWIQGDEEVKRRCAIALSILLCANASLVLE